MYQEHLFNDYQPGNPADVVYTPHHIAADMLDYLKPQGKILDPCIGGGVFFNLMPEGADWCEVQQGRDFFAWDKPVDWLIGNPPYSIFGEWMRHSMSLADDIAYLIPIAKVFSVEARMREIFNYGGIVSVRYYGKGTDVGFPFGFPCGCVHVQRNYCGPISVSFYT